MIVIAYYTVGTPYEDLVGGFKRSLKNTNPDLRVVVQPVLCVGSWESNCALKSAIIYEALIEYNEDLLYIDIDAEVKSKILFPEFEEDIAVRYRNGELLSGTIFIKNTIKSREILYLWMKEQDRHPEVWDQKILDNVVKFNDIKLGNLNEEFCSIFDAKERGSAPVIVHNQASRKFKKLIGGDVMNIPKAVGKMRLIKNRDGTISIARSNAVAERILDRDFERLPNQLKWRIKVKESQKISSLVLQGKKLYIIGKGPSLDNLSKKDFPDKKAPIFAINESIHAVEALNLPNDTYVVLQDVDIVEGCKPKKASILCDIALLSHFAGIEKVQSFNKRHFIKNYNYTPVVAINLGKKFGIEEFTMLCFDSLVNGDKSYAKIIGYQHPKMKDKKRYSRNKLGIKEALGESPVEFICPTPRKESFDKSPRKEDKDVQGNSEAQS